MGGVRRRMGGLQKPQALSKDSDKAEAQRDQGAGSRSHWVTGPGCPISCSSTYTMDSSVTAMGRTLRRTPEHSKCLASAGESPASKPTWVSPAQPDVMEKVSRENPVIT